MPLFNCSRCGVIENTALGAYWHERAKGRPVLCSECATGKWHGRFPREFGETPNLQKPSRDTREGEE
jgi:hypothetical protein